jgi:hypothetical protein
MPHGPILSSHYDGMLSRIGRKGLYDPEKVISRERPPIIGRFLYGMVLRMRQAIPLWELWSGIKFRRLAGNPSVSG